MNKLSALAITTSPFDDAIARLKLLQSIDTSHRVLIHDETAICLQNLESLQTNANNRSAVLLIIKPLDKPHWIACAIISAISNVHERLSIEIERLLLLLDNNTPIDFCQDPTLQKSAFAQIQKLNDLAASTLRLEQQVLPALLENIQNDLVQTPSNLYQTLH